MRGHRGHTDFTREELVRYAQRSRTFEHPEVGRVLYNNSGAAGEPGSNNYSFAQGPARGEVATILEAQKSYWGQPEESRPVIVAELASDGWWWRILDY